MKKTTIGILSAIVMLSIAACNGGATFKRTKSGMMYKIMSDGKNPIAKTGQILKFDFTQKVRDSILGSSVLNGPVYVPVDSVTTSDYNPNEIFGLLRKGDSAVVIFEADTLRKKQGGLPPFLKAKDKIYLTFKVLEVFVTQEAASKDRELSMQEFMKKQEVLSESQKIKDVQILKDYVKSKGISVVSAPKGTLVEITTAGTGASCDSGKFLSVMYTGKSMTGTSFDSNIDPQFGHAGEPYVFQVAARGAIEGWSDGLSLFKKGGKGRLYIPSSLAWGKMGSGEKIKPDDNVIFDVEVVDVSDTRPAPPAPPAIKDTVRSAPPAQPAIKNKVSKEK